MAAVDDETTECLVRMRFTLRAYLARLAQGQLSALDGLHDLAADPRVSARDRIRATEAILRAAETYRLPDIVLGKIAPENGSQPAQEPTRFEWGNVEAEKDGQQ